MEQTINARGWECPKPIIETKKVLDAMQEGTVTTIVDNETALRNLVDFAGSLGYDVSHTVADGVYSVVIHKEKALEAVKNKEDDLVIVITTDQFGHGSRELSENLMKSYIYALTEVDKKPRTLIFINSGIFYTTEGSAVEESLKVLAADGVEILTCGACLNYYGLTEKLIAGSISNMYMIADRMNNAANTIKL